MPWPTPQDYNEAIQSPHICFSDTELKQGIVETTAIGLPRPITGGFASVYHLKCGTRDWAVRCFLREFNDQQERYAAISDHLNSINSPYIVGFQFLPQGIKIKGNWFPILKMEWVKGDLLSTYIAKNLAQPHALVKLAERWMVMISALRGAGVAHGDLQHGNVVVENGDFRLIDYDGMFVPTLDGKFSNESGHRNYQHPQRTEFDFGPRIDNFSGWVVYVSLIALSIDRSLWNRTNAGDESLLFRREDFLDPFISQNLALLSSHTDQRIRSLGGLFQSIIFRSPDDVPPIDTQIQAATTSGRTDSHQQSAPSNRPAWLYGEEPNSADRMSASEQDVPTSAADSTWVLDFIADPGDSKTTQFDFQIGIERVSLVAGSWFLIIIVAANVYLGLITAITPTSTIFSVVLGVTTIIGTGYRLWSLYHGHPLRQEMIALGSVLSTNRRQMETYQHKVTKFKNRLGEAQSLKAKRERSLNDGLTQLRDRERLEKDQISRERNLEINAINAKLTALNQDEAKALRDLNDGLGVEITRLNDSIALLIANESRELDSALKTKQNLILDDFLGRYSIRNAKIFGIGDGLKARLLLAGIYTAKDIEYWRLRNVPGIGLSRAVDIEIWRDNHASRAQIPNALTVSEISAIKVNYASKRQDLERQRAAFQTHLKTEVTTVKARYENDRKPLTKARSVLNEKTDQKLRETANRYATQYKTFNGEQAGLILEAVETQNRIVGEIRQLRKQAGELQWQLAKSQRDMAAYRNVNFKSFFRSVVGI